MGFINIVTGAGGGQDAPSAPKLVFGPSGSQHAVGFVPDPGATVGATRYLREDCTWQVPSGGGGGGISDAPSDGGIYARKNAAWLAVQTLFVQAAQIGVANGVASLDGTGKVPTSQLPASVVGGLNYQGVWNATTNTPTLVSGTGTKGFYYKVNVAGTTSIDGNASWNIGDVIAFDGTTWDKFDGTSTEVTSVNGGIGAVTITAAGLGAVATSSVGAASGVASLDGTSKVPIAQIPAGAINPGVMVASGASHAAGLAPDPGATAGTTHYLREDGTWAVPPTGGSSLPASATLRNIATRCATPGFTNTGITNLFSRSAHINRSDATTGFQPVFANWYATFANEFTGYASYAISAALEYPAGTYTRLTFGGLSSVTIPAGTNATADACAVVVPTGARFWIRVWVQCPNGIFTINGPAVDINTQVSGDQNLASATTIGTDYTVNALVGSGAMTSLYPPVAVLATSSKPSIIAYGDSRLAGLKDAQGGTNGGYGGFGEITRGYDAYVAYCNVGCPTGTAAGFITAHTFRAALKTYHTQVHIQYGINDLNVGTTAAALETSLTTICGYFAGMKISANTIPPQCTSTDAFATQANQTQFAGAAQRQLHNTWLRGTTHPFGIVFDISDIGEYHRSGNWLTPDVDPRIIAPITFEGTHWSPWGYLFLQKSGAVDGRVYEPG